ncbi:MAG: hypothetical protein LBO62_05115 [Endomicrobium sp.]|jgi:outer membrane murein-binding lipoprotein Lpp|nr:hypothetical protein [Endomicrobium sp.]
MKTVAVLLLPASFLLCSCVSSAKYDKVLVQLEQIQISQHKLEQENKKMTAEIESLEERNEYIKKIASDYQSQAEQLEKYMRSSKAGKSKTFAAIAADRLKLRHKITRQELEIKNLREQNRKLSETLENTAVGKK